MRIRKQQRQTDGIPNGPPRPSIDRIVEAVEQLPPRQRWLLRLRLRAFFIQEPRPAKPKPPKPPKTREEALGAKLRAYAAERRRELGLPEIPWQALPPSKKRKKASR